MQAMQRQLSESVNTTRILNATHHTFTSNTTKILAQVNTAIQAFGLSKKRNQEAMTKESYA